MVAVAQCCSSRKTTSSGQKVMVVTAVTDSASLSPAVSAEPHKPREPAQLPLENGWQTAPADRSTGGFRLRDPHPLPATHLAGIFFSVYFELLDLSAERLKILLILWGSWTVRITAQDVLPLPLSLAAVVSQPGHRRTGPGIPRGHRSRSALAR